MDTFSEHLQHTRVGVARQWASLASFVASEADGWNAYVTRRRAAVSITVASSDGLERRALAVVERAVASLHGRIRVRLEQLSRGALPLPDYESLTARAIVSEIDRLDADACRRLRDHEAANKQRATVMRALDQRLAA
jgi:hypothetical protein